MINDGSPFGGFCACCSFTQADAIFNALYHLNLPSLPEDADLLTLFKPRPQSGHFFPRVSFTTRAKRDVFSTWPEDVVLDFNEECPRMTGSRFLTMCVHAMGHSNWPDGVKKCILGTVDFTPGMSKGHDIKRGCVQEMGWAGVQHACLIR